MLLLIYLALVLGFGCVAAATGCHGECCTTPDIEEIKAGGFSGILFHLGMLYLSLGRKLMRKAKQIITGHTLFFFFNFRRQQSRGMIPDSKQSIPSVAMTGMSGIH